MTRRFCLAVLLVAAMLVGQGCKSTGPSATAPILDALEAQKLGYTLRWTSSLSTPSDSQVQRVVAFPENVVTIEAPQKLVTCVSMRDGAQRWKRVIGEKLDKLFTPYMIGNDLCINSENKMYVLDPYNGDMKPMSDLETPVSSAP